MVSLDDAVIARLEKGGNRYEILVDPELVSQWKEDNNSVEMEDMLATDEIWSDVKAGDRPTSDALENIFGSTDLHTCVKKILVEGSIQLTTTQRKRMVEDKRKQIINAIATTATDPKTRGPHPPTMGACSRLAQQAQAHGWASRATSSGSPLATEALSATPLTPILQPLVPILEFDGLETLFFIRFFIGFDARDPR